MIYNRQDKSMDMYQRMPYMPQQPQQPSPYSYNNGGMYTPPMNMSPSVNQNPYTNFFGGMYNQMPNQMYNPMPMGGGKGSPKPPMPMGGGKGGNTPMNQPFQTPMGSYTNMGFNPSGRP